VELEEPAAKRGAADKAAPELADEACGILRREVEEHLLHELLHQLRRRRQHAPPFNLVARSAAEGSADVRSEETLFVKREELDQTLVMYY